MKNGTMKNGNNGNKGTRTSARLRVKYNELKKAQEKAKANKKAQNFINSLDTSRIGRRTFKFGSKAAKTPEMKEALRKLKEAERKPGVSPAPFTLKPGFNVSAAFRKEEEARAKAKANAAASAPKVPSFLTPGVFGTSAAKPAANAAAAAAPPPVPAAPTLYTPGKNPFSFLDFGLSGGRKSRKSRKSRKARKSKKSKR